MQHSSAWLETISTILPGIGIIVGLLLFVFALLRILDLYRLFTRKIVFLELTPPASLDRTPIATQHLFTTLHGLEAARPWIDKLLRRKFIFSLEVVSSRKQGIRYILSVSETDASLFEHNIASYLPDAKLKRVEDYLDAKSYNRLPRTLEFKQTGHFAYPLQGQISLEQHDPVAYLAGTMTKLAANELMVFQIVAHPAKVRRVSALHKRLLNNEELVYNLSRHTSIGGALFSKVNSLLLGTLDLVSTIGTSNKSRPANSSNLQHNRDVAMKIKPARVLSTFEQELAKSVYDKLSQPLFEANIRAMVIMNDKSSEKLRAKNIRASLASFSTPRYQALRAHHIIPSRIKNFVFRHRLPSLLPSSSCILSASEIASIYHLPHIQSTKTENIVKSLSRTLPAPLSLKNNSALDIVLGRNHYHGTVTDIGLTAPERERHVYIIGGTGNGKTTMMLYAIVQDIKNGKGLAIVDPHGDLAETILQHIPKERVDEVIYFNPDDLSHPIGMNLLELPPNLTGDELLREKDLVTESTISVFRKIFSDDDSGGHRIEYVLRNTIQTALTQESPTLFTIFNLLNDPKYRRGVVKNLEDKDLKNFWQNEMGKAGEFQRVKMAAGITAKIGRFLFSASAKRVLEQPKSTIDFDDIINSGKILVCNFSKGLLGEDTSELFGITVLAKLQLASLRRARVQQSLRLPFYLYVDEFQNFATTSFVQLLSEARKYKLFLLMAEQSTSQQEEQRMVNIILANVGTVICFRSGNPADENLMLPLFTPYIETGEIASLPSYSFYARIAAVHSQEPMSGMTILLSEEGSEEISQRVIEVSRQNYTIKAKEPEIKTADIPATIPKPPSQRKSRAKKQAQPVKIGRPIL